MPVMHIYVSQETMIRLEECGSNLGRTVTDLAECAVAEAALAETRNMSYDEILGKLRVVNGLQVELNLGRQG